MSRTFIPPAVRERVATEARHRCGYCQTQQAVVGMPLHIDHIIPEAAGGSSEIGNLWLACPLCNNYKGTQTHATDPASGERVSLFNPRTQDWHVHFRWTDDGTEIVGLSHGPGHRRRAQAEPWSFASRPPPLGQSGLAPTGRLNGVRRTHPHRGFLRRFSSATSSSSSVMAVRLDSCSIRMDCYHA